MVAIADAVSQSAWRRKPAATPGATPMWSVASADAGDGDPHVAVQRG